MLLWHWTEHSIKKKVKQWNKLTINCFHVLYCHLIWYITDKHLSQSDVESKSFSYFSIKDWQTLKLQLIGTSDCEQFSYVFVTNKFIRKMNRLEWFFVRCCYILECLLTIQNNVAEFCITTLTPFPTLLLSS